MDRRRFVAVAGSALAFPPLVLAQGSAPRVNILTYAAGEFADQYVNAFLDGMKALGYVQGRNIHLARRSGERSRELTHRLAAEAVAAKPAVIVAQGAAIRATAALTKTIPIVAANSGDMVDLGLAKSLARPGGNVTGIQLMAVELAGKRMQLLRELLPKLTRVAVIADPGHAGEHRERDVSLRIAEKLGVKISYYAVHSHGELDLALEAARAGGAEALVLFPDTVTNGRTAETAEFALKNKLPTVAGWANYVSAGQLISYGPDHHACWRRIAHFVDRILKGANPGDLPVELPTAFELVVNLRTARTLGLTIPQSILLRADRVIE